jgi:hypothetical protein
MDDRDRVEMEARAERWPALVQGPVAALEAFVLETAVLWKNLLRRNAKRP